MKNQLLINQSQQGFSLVEIMVVVVILTIFAGMMTLSVGSSDSRKNMAFYEHLQSNLRYIRLLSAEQMQPYGIFLKKNNDGYQIVTVKLDNAYVHQQTLQQENSKNKMELSVNIGQTAQQQATWKIDNQMPALDIPHGIEISITALDNPASLVNQQNLPAWFTNQQSPPVIWFGTGEATPVQIQVNKKNIAEGHVYPVANPLIINMSGAVEVAK